MPKTQIETLIAPRGGVNFSQRPELISPLELSNCQNVFFEEGLIKKRFGYNKFGNNLPLSGSLMGFDQYYQFGGEQFLLAMTTKDIYQWNVTDKTWDLLTENAQKDDCETNWTASANVACALDEDEKEGTYSVKISPEAGFGDGLLAYHDSAVGNISTYNHVRLWVKSSIAMTAGHLQFLIDDTAACATPLRELDLPAIAKDKWTLVLLDMRDENGSVADLTAIASLGLKATSDFGACDIRIDDIKVYKCFTGTDKDYFSYDYMRDKNESEPWWLCTNGVDNIKKFDGDTFGDLGGSPPKAKHLIEFKDHLHLCDVTEAGEPYPQRDRWSDTASPEEWTAGNASYKDLPGADFISAPFKFKGNYLVVFKERDVRMGMATGDSEIFEFPSATKVSGAAVGRTIESLGDELIFLGWDDIYVFNGIDCESIGDKVRTELFRTLVPEEIGRSFCVVIEEQKECHLFTVESGEEYPNSDWCFNYNLNTWTRNKYADYMTAYGYYFLETALRWCDLEGSWAVQTWRWGDRTILAVAPTTLFGDKDGNVYEYTKLTNNDDGVAIDASSDSKDFRFTTGSRQRIVGLDVYYKGPSLKVYCSTNKGSTWNLIATLSASTDLETPQKLRGLRINCRQVRFRFRNAELNEHFDFSEASIYWQKAGARL